jgi:hypothetical protein
MRAAPLLVCLCACSPSGTFVLLTVQGGAGVPDGIVSLELALALGGKNATAHFDKHGAALSLPTTLVLDVGSGAGALSITADGNDASGQTLAEGTITATVIRGQTVTATVTLDPIAGNQLTIDRMQYDFGTITTNTTAGPIAFTVTNNGSSTSGVLTHNLTGDAGAFEVSGCDGQALAPGATCVVQVTFKPSAAGSFQITLAVAGSPGGSVSATISGTAVAPSPLKITPSPQDYGDVLIGVTVSQLFTLTNTGSDTSGALTTAVTGSDAAQFVVGADGCDGQTLAPQASCTLTVTFTPSGTTGDRAASLTLTGTPGGTAVSTLSGRALTPASLSPSEMTHDFGTVDVGQSVGSVSFTITNNGGQSTGMLTTALSGSTADFVVDTNACTGQSLPYLGTCMLSGHFAPQSFGPKSLTVTLSGMPGAPAVMTWTGVGHDQVTLTVTQPFGGDSSGSVTGPSISCPGTCSATIDRSGASAPVLMLTASPSPGAVFASWSGDCTGTNPQCTLTMDGSKSTNPTFNRARFTLTVTANSIGGATGLVTSTTTPSESGEINCGTTCNIDRYYGDTVTLSPTPSPSPGVYWGGWGGDCSGTDSCTVTMTAPHSVVAHFTVANKIFTTAATYTQTAVQNLGTGPDAGSKMLSGADAICATAGGAGTWMAFLSRSGVNARDRIPASARGWVRPDGLPFGDSLSSILDTGEVFYPPVLDEHNNPVAPTDTSWTGGPTGSSSSTCTDWTNTSSSVVTGGTVGGGSYSWAGDFLNSASVCNATMHLVCMQTDYFAVVGPPALPANPRYMFVTSSQTPGSNTLSGMDSRCASESAGLPGTYHAFVAVNGSSPASRFTATGAIVVRPDGVVISTTDTSLLSGGTILAPISKEGPGFGYLNFEGYAWTGTTAANANGTTSNTCYNASSWSTKLNPNVGQAGVATHSGDWLNNGTHGCPQFNSVYCLQD